MAGGKSAKGATPPKQLLELDGVPILFLTLRQLAACRRLERLIVAVRSSDRGAVEARLKKEGYAARVTVGAAGGGGEGGRRREAPPLWVSAAGGAAPRGGPAPRALEKVPPGTDLVLVH